MANDLFFNYRKKQQFIHDTLDYRSPFTTFHWISATLLLITALILILLSFIINAKNSSEIFYSGIILLCFTFLNLYLVFKENKLRHNEMPRKVSALLATLKLAIRNVKWDTDNYPNLCSPFSPCVTLQWVHRDGAIVNLPWALLVRGDIIVMRPGKNVSEQVLIKNS